MHVFTVTLHFVGGETSEYTVAAKNDLLAREKAIKINRKEYSGGDVFEIEYAVIEFVNDLDG